MKLPLCQSPNHPHDAKRDTMVLVEEKTTCWMFGCKLCKELGFLSVQLRTKPVGWEKAKHDNLIRGVEKAKYVQKKQNRITYFH
jgi:hypothetical protein